MSRKVDLVIKYNNCVTNDPCGICGARTDPVDGPDVFVEGTWSPVCWPCVKKHNPALAAMMQVLHDGTGRDWQALVRKQAVHLA